MLTLDERGLLKPYEVIEISLEEFQWYFVDNLEDAKHRKAIFKNYIFILEELKLLVGMPFYQWLNGSFTTLKAFPNDIDTISFIQSDLLTRKGGALLDLKQKAKDHFKTDLHLAPVYKWNHRFSGETQQYEQNWKDIFGFSRRDSQGIKHPKGIIQINF